MCAASGIDIWRTILIDDVYLAATASQKAVGSTLVVLSPEICEVLCQPALMSVVRNFLHIGIAIITSWDQTNTHHLLRVLRRALPIVASPIPWEVDRRSFYAYCDMMAKTINQGHPVYAVAAGS